MADASQKSILFVDDSAMMRQMLQNALDRCGYTDVTGTASGAEALAICKKKHFDCILVDWNMPEMDGMQLIDRLRQNPDSAKIPIMMITSESTREDVIHAFVKGVTLYIVKPFTLAVFREKMIEIFSD